MAVYWSLVLFPMLVSLAQRSRHSRRSQLLPLGVMFVVLFVFLALRETGGDYLTYVRFYELMQDADFVDAVTLIEPLYGFLNWAAVQLDLGIYGVNAVCALIFLGCLYRAALKERQPFFLLTLAIPYFVIVVGMGYTRQGVAAALILLSVVLLREGRPGRAAVAILLASGFHYSALAALALPIFAVTEHQRGLWWLVSRVVLIGVLLVSMQFFFSERIDTYSTNYIVSDRYESGGALLRSLVTAAAAVMFFLCRRTFKAMYADYGIWRPFAWLGLVSVPLSLVASTPVDRLGLYLIPFQLVTFSRLPMVIKGGRSFEGLKLAILAGYLAYFFVWIHLGNFAEELWLPYRWIFSDPE